MSQPRGLRRVLTTIDTSAVLIGITIGAGIFAVPQQIALNMSSFNQIIWLWVGCGALAFVGYLIYAELGTRLPVTGGEYVYINRAFGPLAGFIFGWAQIFIIRSSPLAGLSLVAVAYFEFFVDLLPWQETVLALCIIAALCYLNYTGIQYAKVYQNFSTVVKVGGLLLLVIIGLVALPGSESKLGETAASQSRLGFTGSIADTILLILFTLVGWERLGYAAGEMKDPNRSLPRALMLGFVVVFVIYLATNFVYHNTLGLETIRETNRVGADLATVLLGPIGAGAFAILVIISATGSLNGTILAAPRVYYAMAKDRLFFRWLNYVHPTYRTPSRAVLLQCGWGAVILLVRGSFEAIATGMVFVILIFYAVTTAALFVLRYRKVGEGNVLFKVPGYPVLPALYLVLLLTLILVRGVLDWQQSLIDLSFVLSGIPAAAYFFWRRRVNAHES
ncbi:MAG: amino acid permease [Bacteroidetes bacterium]|nr:amino acid permease [Bacteroidota bacterium]